MRVRSSPFGQPGSGNGVGPTSGSLGQGLTGAPMPPRPTTPAAANIDDFDFDGWGDAPVSAPTNPAPAGRGFQQHMPVQPPVPQQQAVQPQMPTGHPQPPQPAMYAQAQQPMMQPQAQQPMMQPPGPMAASLLNAGIGAMGSSMGLNETVATNMAAAAAMQLKNNMEGAGVMGWFPNTFNIIHSLFNVGHSYVLRKLLLLMCPFIKRNQGAPPSNNTLWMQGGDSTPTAMMNNDDNKADNLKSNIEEPDLYIPLMSYMTYILVYGMQRGMVSKFSPEVIPSTASFALVLLILEVGTAKMGFYIAGSTVPILDVFANCGYKFAPVVLMVAIRILTGGNPIYYVFFAYFAACAAWAIRRFLLHFEPSQLKEQYGVAPSRLHMHIILGLAIAQIPLCWLLTPSAPAAAAAAATAAK